jgi:hypothetical protein
MSGSWNRELEGGLPDCRLIGPRRRATTVPLTMLLGRMLMERVFCGNCGADGGLVTAEWAAHIFYLCDDCAHTHGKLDLPELSEATVRGNRHARTEARRRRA